MALLTREIITRKTTFEMVEVDVSEWDDSAERTTVFVREMSARERDDYEASLVTGKGKKTEVNFKDMRAKLAAATCCDADGTLIFRPEDVEWLSAKPVKVLNRICDAARKLNGLNEDDEEDTVKN
jgi:hypothetical protein